MPRGGDERRAVPAPRVASPTALPEVLGRLLRADAPDSSGLVALWPLDTAGDQALSYALERAATGPRPARPPPDIRSQPGHVDAIAQALDGADMGDLLLRQTGVVITDAGLRPLFREIRFARAALEARVASVARTDQDPFLFRHLAERLDLRLIGLIERAVGTGGGLDPTLAGAPRLHLNLTLGTLKSDGFARLAETLLGRGLSLGVEISLLEACADPDRYEQARGALRRLGMAVVLDGVTRDALGLARVSALEPDLVKLAWSPRMADREQDAPGPEQSLIRDLGPDRVMLHHAENEAALRWGLERGIRRFQGRHVEAMLGALRLSACPEAGPCALRQCIQRAAAASAAGRVGCRNIALLDAGAPPLRFAQARPAPARVAARADLATVDA